MACGYTQNFTVEQFSERKKKQRNWQNIYLKWGAHQKLYYWLKVFLEWSLNKLVKLKGLLLNLDLKLQKLF